MGKPEPLWKALSFTSLMLGIGAVMGGNASAQVHGNAEFFPATICLLFVIFTQLAANAHHRYNGLLLIMGYDPHTPLHVVKNKELHGQLLFYRIFSGGLTLMAVLAGCTLLTMGGLWFGLVGILVIVLGWGMVGGKSPLLLSPWGCIFTFILFGPIAVIATSLLQSAHETSDPLSWFDISPAIFMSIVIGLMASNAYLVFIYSSYFKQEKLMRDTFTATFGRRATRTLFLVCSIAASAIFIASCFLIDLDYPWIGAIPGLICLIINILIWQRMSTFTDANLASLANWACFNVLLMGILASIVSIFVGIPDDSHLQIF